MRGRVLVAGLIAGLTLVGTAGGYAAGRVVTVRAGDRADFPLHRSGGGGWSCSNMRGRFVRCFSGDAYPYVTVGNPGFQEVNVKVYMSGRIGRVTRTYERGRPVYVFTAG